MLKPNTIIMHSVKLARKNSPLNRLTYAVLFAHHISSEVTPFYTPENVK